MLLKVNRLTSVGTGTFIINFQEISHGSIIVLSFMIVSNFISFILYFRITSVLSDCSFLVHHFMLQNLIVSTCFIKSCVFNPVKNLRWSFFCENSYSRWIDRQFRRKAPSQIFHQVLIMPLCHVDMFNPVAPATFNCFPTKSISAIRRYSSK